MLIALFTIVSTPSSVMANDADLNKILERLERLEAENAALKNQVQVLVEAKAHTETQMASEHTAHGDHQHAVSVEEEIERDSSDRLITFNPEFGYDFLDANTNINRKQQMILRARQDGSLAKNAVNVQGSVTAIANVQSSNEPNLFGYLMRHPTGNNQRGTTVSEATIHSTQLGFTATMGDWVSASAEFLYDPEQSFGAGTNTALTRNQVQARKAYVLLGNLDKSPFYASLGKQAIPFGLTDSVNPFTNSTVWHAFGGIANGGIVGYQGDSLNVSFMAVQGGAQFRSANVPVEGTSVPSKLNNYAVDANYTINLDSAANLLLGASYQRGSAYCQSFPITHFSPCEEENPAWDVYAQYQNEAWTVKSEIAKTTDEWAGTFNPSLPQFAASKVTSFDLGVQYRNQLFDLPVAYSAEFSRFEAGPSGAEWEKQDQLVLGLAMRLAPSVELFAEYIDVNGYAPLNFLSGGHIPGMPQIPVADASADSEVYMLGVTASF